MLTFSVARHLLGLPLATPARVPEPDPIDHPSFRAKSIRKLAGLPFPRPTPRDGSGDALDAVEPPTLEPDAARPAA